MLPEVGTRLALSAHLATVLYAGPVAGTSGLWLGVEWDDPARGKHDGAHHGVRYFDCRVPGAGSFIRPTAAGLSYGRPFPAALLDKYAGDAPRRPAPASTSSTPAAAATSAHGAHEPPASQEQEKELVPLGSSLGLITVEAVGLDKVRSRLARLDKLRDVSLDGEGVASAGEPGEIRQRCPNLRTLDLSRNLLPSWEVVVLILSQLDLLESLSLNQNRLHPLSHPLAPTPTQPPRISHLELNGTLLPWSQLPLIAPAFPAVRVLQMGYNRLSSLSLSLSPAAPWPSDAFPLLKELNLECNALTSLPLTLEALAPLPVLERLILTSNTITSIPFPPSSHPAILQGLKYLSLASNPLSDWQSMSALDAWLPHLEGLSVVCTPLLAQPTQSQVQSARALLLGHLGSLTLLNGTPVTRTERADGERFYLSWIVSEEPGRGGEERGKGHPRWAELCARHGVPGEGSASAGAKRRGEVLASRLVTLNVALMPSPPTGATLPPPSGPGSGSAGVSTASVKLLPSMPLKALRTKLLRTLKLPLKGRAGVWACSRAAAVGESGRAGEDEGAGTGASDSAADTDAAWAPGGEWVIERLEGEGNALEHWGLREGDWLVVVLYP
ncbi:hypothetical protein CALCODRAFT_479850 [Calocera cornea HHB12733]|uniref:CAP-Gly domain-containing protein n=1 Tax=Calocera cornea HHB12733 TaxID=1353952 RepID=A0A165JAC6_9BASI|nr:hypothetical protein CALCODRAFT_479850 [Calocera cornea HHB12733]